MLHCLRHIRHHMKNKIHRKIILEMIHIFCTQNSEPKNTSIKIKIRGFQSLVSLASLYYDFLTETILFIAQDNNEIY